MDRVENHTARLILPEASQKMWFHWLLIVLVLIPLRPDIGILGFPTTLGCPATFGGPATHGGFTSPQDSISTLSPVCVRLRAATVRLISGTDVCSGVLISREGHLLTVSHGLQKDRESVTVFFHDGVFSEAAVLLRDSVTDVALLKLTEIPPARSITPIEIRTVATTDKGINVIAAGYPGREKNGRSPVMRLGDLLAVDAGSLRSSCTLTAGDSGGPLVDLSGQLIGLHRQIGPGTESNHHIPVEQITEAIRPQLDLSRAPFSSANTIENSSASPGKLSIISDRILKVCRERTVEIIHEENSARVALGTLLDQEHAATKLSELQPGAPVLCRFRDGSTIMSTIVKSDAALDVCILKLSAVKEGVSALALDGAEETLQPYLPIAASVATDANVGVGMLTRVQHTEPVLSGKLGVVLGFDPVVDAVRIMMVVPNSTAANAGLQPGDRLSGFCEQRVTDLDDVSVLLRIRQPGDWISFQFERNMLLQTSSARLMHDPAEKFERTEFLDGRSGRVSERRSGFEDILQHDLALTPDQCGGPLCDLSGRIIAINIARRARESTLAVPIGKVIGIAHKP